MEKFNEKKAISRKIIKIATTIFIIPHYDDELGIFNQIMLHKQQGQKIVVIYLTSSDKREKEIYEEKNLALKY